VNRAVTISPEVRAILMATTCDGAKAFLPPSMPRTLYTAVNAGLEKAGGKWNKGAQCHLFTTDAAAAIGLLLNGEKLSDLNPHDFFATPADVADLLVQSLRIDWTSDPHILEPSAGDGAIVQALARSNSKDQMWNLDAMEIDSTRCNVLIGVCCSAPNAFVLVSNADFLDFNRANTGPYDYVAMNPPFTAEGVSQAYMLHVEQAITLLRPGGRLAAIVPNSLDFGTTKRHDEFRALLSRHGATWEALPDGAFKSSGTAVKCLLLTLEVAE
jgi:predicted RNA methylase